MIKAISLKNFKSFLDSRIQLSTLNLLTGINGVGKSTLIQALLLLRQSYLKNIFPSKGILLNGELFNLGKGGDALSIHSTVPEIYLGIEFSDLPNLDVFLKFVAESDLLPLNKKKSSLKKESFKHALFNNSFKYLNAERISPKVSYNVSLFEVEENKSLGIHGEYTSLFLAKYQREPINIESLLHENNPTNTLIEQVSAWLQDISPGINLKSQYYPEIDAAKFNYQFEYGDLTTPEFRPTNVGFGLTYALPIITSILSSQPGDIVIIENPESHLHPSGQFKLGEMLFKAAVGGLQTIVETHSDHVLNGIRVSINKHKKYSDLVNVVFFERDKKSKKHISSILKPKLDDNGRIDSWPVGFFDEWDKSLIQLL